MHSCLIRIASQNSTPLNTQSTQFCVHSTLILIHFVELYVVLHALNPVAIFMSTEVVPTLLPPKVCKFSAVFLGFSLHFFDA
jgi:hypothetical protein